MVNIHCFLAHHDHPLVSLLEILSVRDATLNLASALRVCAGDVTPPLHQHVTEREHQRAQRLVVCHDSAFVLSLGSQRRCRSAISSTTRRDRSGYPARVVLFHHY